MKALFEVNFKPYAMTDDKPQGRQDQEKIVEDDFRTQFQFDRNSTILVGSTSSDAPRFEAEINKLVYALYDLKPEEIAIVEGNK